MAAADDATNQWEELVARFGEREAHAGNDLLLEVEYQKDRFYELRSEDRQQEAKAQYRQYKRALQQAAEAAVGGNAYLRHFAETMPDLSKEMKTIQEAQTEGLSTGPAIAGSPDAPIHMGLSIEQQMRFSVSSERERRSIMDKKPDPYALFVELYEDVARTADGVPIGVLERHAEGRLQQTYAALLLIEQSRDAGIIPEGATFVATGAVVQDKMASREYPAAHRLPADLAIETNGVKARLSDYFDAGIERTWIDKHVFGPTDRMHRLANVADQWCEDAGMKRAFVDAANAISSRRMTANQAMKEIIEPGYAGAIEKALSKVERNFSFMERQALSRRVVDIHGRPFQQASALALGVKDLESRAAAKDVIERTLKAYQNVRQLPLDKRMKSAMAVTAIVDGQVRNMGDLSNEDRRLTMGAARLEAQRTNQEAQRALQVELDQVQKLANKAQEAVSAANDVSRPMQQRLAAAGDAHTYSEKMKTNWSDFQREKGPKIIGQAERRLGQTRPYGVVELAELKTKLSAPPQAVVDTARMVEDMRDRLERQERFEHDRRPTRENVVRLSPRLD